MYILYIWTSIGIFFNILFVDMYLRLIIFGFYKIPKFSEEQLNLNRFLTRFVSPP